MDKEEKSVCRISMKEINVHHIGLANVNSRLKLHFGDGSVNRIRSKKAWADVMEFVSRKIWGCEEQGQRRIKKKENDTFAKNGKMNKNERPVPFGFGRNLLQ